MAHLLLLHDHKSHLILFYTYHNAVMKAALKYGKQEGCFNIKMLSYYIKNIPKKDWMISQMYV